MTKTKERILLAWKNGTACGKYGDSFWTDGTHLYSYHTALLAVSRQDPLTYYLNETKYSRTTSKYQSAVRAWLLERPLITVYPVFEVPWGAQTAILKEAHEYQKSSRLTPAYL